MAYPQIRKGHNFEDGEVVTPDDLDEHADLATLEVSGPGKIPMRATGSVGAGAVDAEADLNDLTGTRHRPDRLQVNGLTTLAYAASVALDFNAGTDLRKIALAGNLTLTTSNRAAGRSLVLTLAADASARTLTFPSGADLWKWITDKPASIAANKTGQLVLICNDANDSGINAAWGVEA
jgi:hypothetical protein